MISAKFFLLDTNVCIYLVKKNPKSVIQRMERMAVSEIGISSITLSELEYGTEKSSNPIKNRITLSEFLAPFEILSYDDRAAIHYGRIRAYLEKSGKIIGPLDTLIAAHCLSLNATLITNNVKEFERVKGLKIENWVY